MGGPRADGNCSSGMVGVCDTAEPKVARSGIWCGESGPADALGELEVMDSRLVPAEVLSTANGADRVRPSMRLATGLLAFD